MGTELSKEGSMAEELASVQRVLEDIFKYYCVQLQEPRLTSTRFQRMAVDSCIIGPRLPSAKVDVTFSQVCGGSKQMSLAQFRDGIVRLSALKFPALSPSDAVLQLYRDHLSAFEGAGEANGIFATLDEETMQVLAQARPSLQVLYEGYFATLLSKQSTYRNHSAALSAAQSAFMQALVDFEVVPDLVAKAAAHSVFREVAKVREPPTSFLARLAGSSNGSGSSTAGRPLAAALKPMGQHFTLAHFVLAVGLAALRCFADKGATAIVRFLEWMDCSKGRVVFAAAFPGIVPAGTSSLRLAPERPQAQSPSASPAPSTRRTLASECSEAAAGAAALACRSSTGRLGDSDARRRSIASKGAIQAAVASLPDWARRLAQQVFAHYAALGDPLNRTHLNSLKFNRFLRDCGLLRSDAGSASTSGAPGGYPAKPEQRRPQTDSGAPAMRRSSSSSRGTGQGGAGGYSGQQGGYGADHRASSKGLVPRRERASAESVGTSESAKQRGCASYTASSAKETDTARGDRGGLPLRVLAHSSLSSVDADLVFVQAVRDQDQGAQAATPATPTKPRATNSSGNSSRLSLAKEPKGKHHMTFASFCHALADVAGRCAPLEASSKIDSLEEFCSAVLAPLGELLGEPRCENVMVAIELTADPETKRLLQRCQPGLERVFQAYAVEAPGRRTHWSSESIMRFAQDFEIAPEVSHLPLQKIFQDCVHHKRSHGSPATGEGEMTQVAFQLALVVLSQRLHCSPAVRAPLERLVSLFARMNACAGGTSLGARLGVQEQLLPLGRASTAKISSVVPPAGDSSANARRSWADLMAAAAA